MAEEIERKFLVEGNDWRNEVKSSSRIVQAYLALNGKAEIRLRIIDDKKALLTIKSASADICRDEFEYEVPVVEAEALFELRSGKIIEKRRHILPAYGNRYWEIDVFEGENEGLSIAEIELGDAGGLVEKPLWLGEEITGDPRYYNATLAQN